jgi:lambda family phage portal protein
MNNKKRRKQSRAQAKQKNQVKAYFRAGDPLEKTMSDWRPRLQSVDQDLNKFRGGMIARTRDLIRNNGYAQSTVYSFLDNVVGHFFNLQPTPSYLLLDRSFEWKANYSKILKARWNAWANSPYNYADYYDELTFVQLLRQATYNYIVDGECLGIVRYRGGAGRYRLKLQLISPERLSTPESERANPDIIEGVQIDKNGRVVGYHICDKHPSESGAKTWKYIAKRSTTGRKQVIHLFDKERPAQKRGRSIFAPIIQQFKLLDDYKITENERAIAQAMFAAVISSDMPSADAFAALGGEMDDDATPYQNFLECQADFKDASGGLAINGSKVAHLATNESLDIIKSDSPNTAYGQFTDANVREIASGTGLSYEQTSKDYSKTTYSSARTAMIETSKRFATMRGDCPQKLANELYSLWLEEDLELVSGYPDATVVRFAQFPAAWVSAQWLAPGKGEIDPLKQSQASKNNLELGRTTLADEAADLGKDFDEITEQRAYEQKQLKELNLTTVTVESDQVIENDDE